MARQNRPPAPGEPDGSDGTGGSSVRRAVSLGSAAADPGPMLAPAARRTAAPEPGEGDTGGTGEAAGTARPTPETPGTSEQPTTTAATTEEPAATATASASRERPEAESESAAEPATAATAADEAAGVGGTATATAAAAGAGADGPPSGNPKKPLLAAAGIAGVVLLAVPLLIWATDDSRQKKEDVAVAAGSDTLLEEEPLEVPKGDYAPAEPTPEPTPEPSTEKPSAKPSPVVKKPAPVTGSASAPVSESPEATKKAEARAERREAPKLPPNTAAYAVQRLAASDPGRHICYRVHRKGAGWTTPRCDGAMSGQNLPITAINIAVVGVKRVSANEFVQKDGWTTAWSGAADGTDLTLGSAASDAPNLSGYAIGVEDGNVCHHHKLGGHDWGAYMCESSEGWRFGGSLEPQMWLESVKFNV
ncbi:hypothetical protein GCM10010415_71070 [Streptomyces atrovirens]|uniref:Hydrophobic W protein n=1 Tax=Streptomyces atrovirens TaxID=285556 RepID=A0ABW0DZH4_9ACTN